MDNMLLCLHISDAEYAYATDQNRFSWNWD